MIVYTSMHNLKIKEFLYIKGKLFGIYHLSIKQSWKKMNIVCYHLYKKDRKWEELWLFAYTGI